LATIVMACSTSPSGDNPPPRDARKGPNQGDLHLEVNTSPVTTGGDVAFTFTNGGDKQVTTGMLDCVNHYEKAESGTWRRVESLRACIALAVGHAPGEKSAHSTP